MDLMSELKYFYNAQAKNFHISRKKYYPEFNILLNKLNQNSKKSVKLLELGCGSGRLFEYLTLNYSKKFHYLGVDLSDNLIEIAKMNNKGGSFVVNDMGEFLKDQEQESYDYVIAIASFQHIYGESQRIEILKNIYRILKYEGYLIMLNWSFSKWFLSKYKKQILNSVLRSIYNFGKFSYNDIFVPWKADDTYFKRYYHIFGYNELQKILKLSGFVIKEIKYTNKNGELVDDWKLSRNSFLLAKKDVLIS